jgi:hypothetical protein
LGGLGGIGQSFYNLIKARVLKTNDLVNLRATEVGKSGLCKACFAQTAKLRCLPRQFQLQVIPPDDVQNNFKLF